MDNPHDKPILLFGGSHTDHRGTISFVNDFDFKGVNRFYTLHHPETTMVRAWQGHVQEAKYYYPVKGSWLIAWVKMDFNLPEDDWKPETIELKAADNKMLYLPPGYANGFRALEPDSVMNGFSVAGSSEEEIVRWEQNKWGIFT